MVDVCVGSALFPGGGGGGSEMGVYGGWEKKISIERNSTNKER